MQCMNARRQAHTHRVDMALGELVAEAEDGAEGGSQHHALHRGCLRLFGWYGGDLCALHVSSMMMKEATHLHDLATLSKTFLVPSTAGFTS